MAQKVYSYLDEPQNAYLLKNGSVFFEIKENELYKISGKNLIVGAGEILLQMDGSMVFRDYNFYRDDETELAPIPKANLGKLIHQYNIGYNINFFQAQMLQKITGIMGKRQDQLSKEDKEAQKLAIEYYKLAQQIIDIGQQFKFKDIIALGNELKNELIFKTGQIYAKESQSKTYHSQAEKTDDFTSSYEHEQIICQQGDEGQEMYILESGHIDVLVNDNKVSSITEKGTVLGEIALLLGETRTATLQANGRVMLTKIKSDNLAGFHAQHTDIFLHIGQTLSRRIHSSFNYIRNLDEQIEKKSTEKKSHFMDIEKIEANLKTLKEKVSKIYQNKKYEQLKPMIDQFDDPLLGI